MVTIEIRNAAGEVVETREIAYPGDPRDVSSCAHHFDLAEDEPGCELPWKVECSKCGMYGLMTRDPKVRTFWIDWIAPSNVGPKSWRELPPLL